MAKPDFNLLITLATLLTEGSVARAAQRLRLSPSAMSRALARLRTATGDPLLVRAGRGLVPTPRALELCETVPKLVKDAEEILRPQTKLNLKLLARTFTLRTRDGFVENFGSALVSRAAAEAPGAMLCFIPKLDKSSEALRSGSVDLETGVVGKTLGPELRAQALFRDHFIGVARKGHPLARGKITPSRFAEFSHIGVSRRGLGQGPVDEALEARGLTRKIATIVTNYSDALCLARTSDLIANVPAHQTGNLRAGMLSFPLPVPTPDLTISLLWHPRFDADPAHRWLRELVLETCGMQGKQRKTQKS